MKTHLVENEKTLCGKPVPKRNEGPGCLRCAVALANRHRLETVGMLEERPKRPLTLLYRVGGHNYRLPLGTRDKRKVWVLVPLIMRGVIRTGKPIARGPQCFADEIK